MVLAAKPNAPRYPMANKATTKTLRRVPRDSVGEFLRQFRAVRLAQSQKTLRLRASTVNHPILARRLRKTNQGMAPSPAEYCRRAEEIEWRSSSTLSTSPKYN
jgi:hypothetical protein